MRDNVAEGIQVGACCAHCMVYYVTEHGYPVLCEDCHYDGATEQKATLAEIEDE